MPPAPLVIAAAERGAMRIAALCEKASGLGLRAGMGLADARAMHPSIDVRPADPEADRLFLETIADWCDRYTPLLAIASGPNGMPDGLFLDVTGCTHLFSGEKAMLEDMSVRLARLGMMVRAAMAGTPGAAYGLCRHGPPRCIVGGGAEAEAIDPLPLAALRLPAETIEVMASVGLRRVEAIRNAPRAPLARRFGRVVLNRLDQALGRDDEAIDPRRPVPILSTERRLVEPIGETEAIEAIVFSLSIGLREGLETRGMGARRLDLSLFRVDGVVHRLSVGTSRPLRDPVTIRRLFRERLARTDGTLDAGFGYEIVRLCVGIASPFAEAQTDLGDGGRPSDDLAGFVERVRARLGENVLRRPLMEERHLPERSEDWIPLLDLAVVPRSTGGVYEEDAEPPCSQERPLRLLRRPEPLEVMAEIPEGPPLTFRWRRVLHRIRRAEGPERIAPPWWHVRIEEDGPEGVRDYYRVEDDSGRRYWLFREGLYEDARRAEPRWFMHGMFA